MIASKRRQGRQAWRKHKQNKWMDAMDDGAMNGIQRFNVHIPVISC